jgi:putative Holliday junction resolvase
VEKRILGIDYGSKRIGVAVSDPLNIVARGLGVVRNSAGMYEEIARFADEYDVSTIVVGMPLNLKGGKGIMAGEVEKFMEALRSKLNRKVVQFDERFTTRAAHQSLRDSGIRKKQRQSKERIDEIASALILQHYLDRHHGGR